MLGYRKTGAGESSSERTLTPPPQRNQVHAQSNGRDVVVVADGYQGSLHVDHTGAWGRRVDGTIDRFLTTSNPGSSTRDLSRRQFEALDVARLVSGSVSDIPMGGSMERFRYPNALHLTAPLNPQILTTPPPNPNIFETDSHPASERVMKPILPVDHPVEDAPNFAIEADGKYERYHLEKEDLEELRRLTASAKKVGWLTGAMMPVRVKGKKFAKDFFLPTTLNYAGQVRNVVAKIFAILGALVFDLLTFPVRLITALPRVLTAPRSSDHQLIKKLKQLDAIKKGPSSILSNIENADLLYTYTNSRKDKKLDYLHGIFLTEQPTLV